MDVNAIDSRFQIPDSRLWEMDVYLEFGIWNLESIKGLI